MLEKLLRKLVGQGWSRVITVTDVKLNKKSRSNGEPLPEKFIGLRKVVNQVVRVGGDFGKEVRNKQAKHGFDKDYILAPSKISLFDSKNGVVRKGIKNALQKYIRVFIVKGKINKNMDVVYINPKWEVVEVSTQEKEDFFPKKYVCQKQVDAGIPKEDEVVLREYKIEGIKYFQKGNAIFNDLSKTLMNLLDLTLVK